MSKVYTIHDVKSSFEREGYVLVSKSYKNSKSKLRCVCPAGHVYSTTWFNWNINGSRCPKCRGGKRLPISRVVMMLTDEDYILISNYINSKTEFLAVCPAGHLCSFTTDSWSNGVRCKLCKDATRSVRVITNLKKDFASEGYTLLTEKYVTSDTVVKFICNNGHVSDITVRSWTRGHRCRKCAGIDKPLIDEVKSYVEQFNYTLLSDKYVNSREKLDLLCPAGHKYSVSFDHFKSKGSRCPTCVHSLRTETKLFDFVAAVCEYDNVVAHDRKLIGPYELDIVVPSKNIAIEYCGLYWHSSKFKDKSYHINKLIRCMDIGYNLITVFEDEFIHRNKAVLNKLKTLLSAPGGENVFNFVIKEASATEMFNFCDDNLTSEFVFSNVHLGLYNLSDVLVSVISLQFYNEICVTLKNYCSVINNDCDVVSMFLDYIKDNFNYKHISMSMSRRWYINGVVDSLFDKVSYEGPIFKYVDTNSINRTEDIEEYKVWDCGSIEFTKCGAI